MSDLDKMKHEPPRTTEQAAAGTTPPSPPAHPNPAVLEDAGSRALSEALRSSFAIVKIVMVLLVIVFFGSGIFTIPSQEKAIILRFGKPLGVGEEQLLGPGLHWSFPYPIDEVVRIPVGNIQTIRSTAGWYQVTPEQEAAGFEPDMGGTLNPAVDGYTITSDGNIMHVRANVRYRITDPLNYTLNFVNATNVLQNAVDNALFFASAHYSVDRAIREDQQGFQELLVKRIRDLVDQNQLGVVIEGADVTTIPPRQVKQAFEQVTISEIERRKARDDAQAYAARLVSTSQGEAATIVNQGKADATRMLQRIAADARYFTNQLAYFEADSESFKSRLQAEAMGRILSQAQGKVITLPRSKPGEAPQLWLQMNRPPRRNSPPAEPQPGQGGAQR